MWPMCTLFLLLPLILCIVFASYAYARRGTQGSWPDICMQRTKLIITPSHHPRKTAFSWPKSTTRSFAHSHSHTRTRTQAQALTLHVLHTPTFKEQSWHSVPLFPGLPLSTTRSRSRSFSPSWHLPVPASCGSLRRWLCGRKSAFVDCCRLANVDTNNEHSEK